LKYIFLGNKFIANMIIITYLVDNNQNECGETFPGSQAFSEPECAGIGNLVNTLGNAGDMVLYIAMHSYGEVRFALKLSNNVKL